MGFKLDYLLSILPRLIGAAAVNIRLAVIIMLLALALGTALTIVRSLNIVYVNACIAVVISFVRGTPLVHHRRGRPAHGEAVRQRELPAVRDHGRCGAGFPRHQSRHQPLGQGGGESFRRGGGLRRGISIPPFWSTTGRCSCKVRG